MTHELKQKLNDIIYRHISRIDEMSSLIIEKTGIVNKNIDLFITDNISEIKQSLQLIFDIIDADDKFQNHKNIIEKDKNTKLLTIEDIEKKQKSSITSLSDALMGKYPNDVEVYIHADTIEKNDNIIEEKTTINEAISTNKEIAGNEFSPVNNDIINNGITNQKVINEVINPISNEDSIDDFEEEELSPFAKLQQELLSKEDE